MTQRVAIIGNLENRRVTGFVEALARRGWPAPILLSHRELLTDLSPLTALPDEPLLVRLDSVGEHLEVERLLLERGVAALPDDARCVRRSVAELRREPPRFGQLLAPRQHHAGLLDYFEALAAVFAQKRHWRVLNPIADLRVLFDKVASSRRYAAAGIPVPEQLPELESIRSAAQLREAMLALRWPAVYVKLSCGSSASGLALFRHVPSRPAHERDMVLTTVARTPEGRFNSLRLQRLEERAAVDELLEWLIDEGAQIERAIAKAQLERRTFDLRVLVVAGEPAFCVVRQSRHPITNLHLGGTRGDLQALRQRVPPAAWDTAMASCVGVFEQHQCLHVGIDLLFEADLRRHRIIEANAFGDLLPGLQTSAGLSVYEHELEQLATRA
jgi:glutathione synthase/RimK-type ligase-like ATP-grasp enzyme